MLRPPPRSTSTGTLCPYATIFRCRVASFREVEGKFRFRRLSTDGEERLLSKPFADPKAAGTLQKQIKALGAGAAVFQVQALGMSLELDGQAVAGTPDYRDEQARDEALARLREALDQLAAQERRATPHLSSDRPMRYPPTHTRKAQC